MLYIVEIPISGEPQRLMDDLNQMRTWLDHMRYQPIAFRQLPTGVCRVDFTDEAQAKVFADAFAGQLLGASGGGAMKIAGELRSRPARGEPP